jgi:hypothetical protein
MKLVVGALAAAVVAGVAFVQPAEARCFWNGFGTTCIHHRGMVRDFDRPFHRDFDRRDFGWRDHGWYR